MNKTFGRHAIVTIESAGSFVTLKTYDAQHGSSMRMYIDSDKLYHWIDSEAQNVFLDHDCGSFTITHRVSRDTISVRLTRLHSLGNHDVKGYTQDFDLRADDENNALPLTAQKYRKIAIVGGHAELPLICGQGSAEVYTDPSFVDSPLDEMKKALPGCEIKFWKGTDKLGYSPTMLWPTKRQYAPFIEDCDAVVVFAGNMESEDTECYDRRSALLNPNFDLYIEHAMKLGKKVIVVLQTGGAVILPPWHKQVHAIVWMGLAGEAAGSAIADILTGRVNPSGRLTETFPTCMRRDLEYPGHDRILEYREKLAVGYRYYDRHPEEIAYSFGHGLSYSAFAYSNAALIRGEEGYTFSFDLTNTGDADGAEVVQLYAADPVSTVSKPEKALIAFKKVFLCAGETTRVTLGFTARDLAYYNVSLHDWVTEDGVYRLLLGASSRDIRLEASLFYQSDMLYTMTPTGETMLG